jgi:hypothetical protein
VLVAVWTLIRLQRRGVELVDVILDEKGTASWTRICAVGGFLISTWVVAHQELTGRLTDAVFGLYLGTFVGGAVIYQFRPKVADAGQDVRVQAPANASVSAQAGPKEGA